MKADLVHLLSPERGNKRVVFLLVHSPEGGEDLNHHRDSDLLKHPDPSARGRQRRLTSWLSHYVAG